MNALNFQRYQFNFVLENPLRLDFYSGSLLRGVFGQSLRHISCMTKMKTCPDCALYRSCPYPAIFETPPPLQHNLQKFSQIPNSYLIEPPPLGGKIYYAGETLSFSMVLIGTAISQLPLIIFAWQRAFALGVGKYNSTAKLNNVIETQSQQIIYAPNIHQSVQPHQTLTLPAIKPTNRLTLQLITPLHLQKYGKVLADDMTTKDLLMALIRRYYLLQEFHGQNYQAPDFSQLAEHAQTITCEKKLTWCHLQRYSSRQQQKMRFDGVLGSISLTGELQPFLPMLQAGQWLHIGNKTSFGMGHYSIDKP
jgi:CRISPR/Cas system endoribonuclease Cas6 (RAMP superfamily)